MLMRQWAALVSRSGPGGITPPTRQHMVAAIHRAECELQAEPEREDERLHPRPLRVIDTLSLNVRVQRNF
jgi:hypothetical protein